MNTNAIEHATDSTVHFRGKDYEIRPIKVGQIPKIAKVVQPVLNAWNELAEETPDAPTELLVAKILTVASDPLIDIVSIMLNIDRAEVEEAELDEFAECVLAIVVENKNFFLERLNPIIQAARGVDLTGATES